MNIRVLISFLLFSFTGFIFATGGGGIFYGNYYFDSEFSNIDLTTAEVFGGYGYGTDRDGTRNGGFGLVMSDPNDNSIHGAFGGVITGQETVIGSLIIGANLWAGFGYSHLGASGLGELNGEVGLAIFPWFQIQAYGGIQYIGPFKDFFDAGIYSPVAGVRLVWGSFSR